MKSTLHLVDLAGSEQLKQSLALQEEVLEIRRETLPENDPRTIDALADVADTNVKLYVPPSLVRQSFIPHSLTRSLTH